MGFIEDLKRQKTKEEEARRTAEGIKRQEESRRIDREAQDRADFRTAKEQFRQSGLGGMIKRLGELDDLDVYTNEKDLDKRDRSREVTYDVDIFFGRIHSDSDFSSSTTCKRISIIVAASGTIKFRGCPAGSSVLGKEEWKDNENVIEEALGKAYRSPIVSTVSSYKQQA